MTNGKERFQRRTTPMELKKGVKGLDRKHPALGSIPVVKEKN
jgi:hypothetical protein